MIDQVVPTRVHTTAQNHRYLRAKAERAGHNLAALPAGSTDAVP